MSSLRILLADDHPQIRLELRLLLEQHEGWTVCAEASDGLEAVEQAAHLKPDMVLLDIFMPKLDGLTAAPLIREKAPNSRIIFLTLHHSLYLARIAPNQGASAYVTKSLIASDLIPAIEALSKEAADTLR